MQRIKSIKLYFFSIIKLLSLSLKNFYFKSNFYNKKLITFIPDRIFYNPSTHLSAPLTTSNQDFYEISNTTPDLLWKTNVKDKHKFDSLHSFLWLTKLDRKNSKIITKKIIKSWINNFFSYEPSTWKMKIIANRIIAWSSNIDITLEGSEKLYKEKFFISLIKQSNFLVKNLNTLLYGPTKIICCSAIILSGMMFRENNTNFKVGIKELEKNVKNYFDESGFPKTRNPEDVFICIKYLIIIREWLNEAQKHTPDFLNEIIQRCGSCYSMLSSSNKKFPLFNGSTELDHRDYDIFLKNLKYKFDNKNYETAGLIKIKKKKMEFFMDCGNPPPRTFSHQYQAGCLAFELISNKQKVICNSGFAKYLSPKFLSLSRSTAAHSTLYINDTSSCVFQKNELINTLYGNSLIEKHKIVNKSYAENHNYYSISASHNGYEKKFGCIHTRSIKILKEKDKIFGVDVIKKTKNYSLSLIYFIRFHIYHDIKIVKTKAGNSILISLSNGEGWLLQSKENTFEIEKNIFFGNKNKIINNESASISGKVESEKVEIFWEMERVS